MPHGVPPPIPSAVPYAPPGTASPQKQEGTAQAVFDTVTGPNLRLKDNLIQLACVIVGAAVGILIGRGLMSDPRAGSLIGAVAGVFGSLLLSGVVIGVIRFITTLRRR
jgi:hypothetical protein